MARKYADDYLVKLTDEEAEDMEYEALKKGVPIGFWDSRGMKRVRVSKPKKEYAPLVWVIVGFLFLKWLQIWA
jgi:hypothetical protein